MESIRYITKNGVHTCAVMTFVRGDSVVKALRGRAIKTKQNHMFVVEKQPKYYNKAFKIFIENIVPGMTHVDLVEAFQKFGATEEIYVIGAKPAAYGFVVFKTEKMPRRLLSRSLFTYVVKGK